MGKNCFTRLRILWVILFAAAFSRGQTGLFEFGFKYQGTQTLYFLELPISASNLALGGHGLTLDDQATMLSSNPSSLARNTDYLYGFSHGEILGEFRHEYIAAVLPIREMGSFGMSANVLTSGAIPEYGADDSYLGTFSELDVALGIGYGRYIFSKTLSAGLNLELLRGQIDNASTFGYGITSGLSWYLGWDLMAAITYHHLSHGVRYDTRRNKLEPIPQYLTMEAGKKRGLGKFAWNIGASSYNSGKKVMYGGGQVFLFNALSINMGFERKWEDHEPELYSGASLGVGIQRNGLQVDAGFKMLPPLGNLFYLSLGFRQKGEGDYGERELLIRAKESYKKGAYPEALFIVENILKKNPKHWNALSLKGKILKELEKEKGNTLSIFYTANTWGNVYPVYSNDKRIGGIIRRATALKKLREKFKTSLLLDAGGLSIKGSGDSLTAKIHQAYGKITYDAVNLGIGELKTYPLSLKNYYQLSGNPYLSSNVSHLEWENTVAQSKILVKGGGLNLGISGLVDPSLVDDSLGQSYVFKDPQHAIKDFSLNQRDSVNIWVVCYYGDLKKAQELARNFKNIDVIVLGNYPKAMDPPLAVGNTIIVSPGTMGTDIGFLKLNLNIKNQVKSFSNEFIELTREIGDDASIAKIFSVDPNASVSSLDKGELGRTYREYFPFVNRKDKAGPGTIYLKNTAKNLDYSFRQSGLNCHSPKLNFFKKRLLYVCEENGLSVLYTQEVSSKVALKVSPENMNVHSFNWGPSGNWIYTAASIGIENGLYKFTSTGNQADKLTSPRLGSVLDFDIDPSGTRFTIVTRQYDRDQIWIMDNNFETPLRISSENYNAASPKWNVNGRILAFLERNPMDSSKESLKLFNLFEGNITEITKNTAIHSYCWSPNGDFLYYSTGINFFDINVYEVKTGIHSKLTNNTEKLRNETRPMPFVFQNKLGILFESGDNKNKEIRWIDLETKKEQKIISLPGTNNLE